LVASSTAGFEPELGRRIIFLSRNTLLYVYLSLYR